MHAKAVAIVGVGLIGGAIGLAAHRRGVVKRVIGIDRSRGRLETADLLGTITDVLSLR
ncbi:MAG: hypothetical protein ACOC7K_00805 [bacterium]